MTPETAFSVLKSVMAAAMARMVAGDKKRFRQKISLSAHPFYATADVYPMQVS
ncbi:MAG TPA: hypothetical protein VIJ25_09590 [Methylococcales bacterium]